MESPSLELLKKSWICHWRMWLKKVVVLGWRLDLMIFRFLQPQLFYESVNLWFDSENKSFWINLCLGFHSGGSQFKNWKELVNIIQRVGTSQALLPSPALEFLWVRFINHSPSAPDQLCPDHHRSHSCCCNSNYEYFYHLSWFSVTHNDLYKDEQFIYSL